MSRVPEGTIEFVVIGAFDGMAQISIDRQHAKSRGKCDKSKKKRLSVQKRKSLRTLFQLKSCRKTSTSHSEPRQCPTSVRQKQAQSVVDHTTLLGCVLISE